LALNEDEDEDEDEDNARGSARVRTMTDIGSSSVFGWPRVREKRNRPPRQGGRARADVL